MSNMQLQPSTSRRRRPGIGTALLNPQVINAGTRLVRQLWNMSQMRSSLPVLPQVGSLNPQPPRQRRSRRRRRNQNNPSSSPTTTAMLRLRDVESFTLQKGFAAFEFSPSGSEKLSRLGVMSKLYARYEYVSVTVKIIGTSSSYNAGTVTAGVSEGGKIGGVKETNILSLRPSFMIPTTKTQSLRVPIRLRQEYDYDKPAWTLYVNSTDPSFYVSVAYDIKLYSPHPLA